MTVASPPRIDALSRDALDARARADAAFLRAQRRRAEHLASALARHDALFRAPDDALLAADQRALALELFDRVLSHQVALDAVAGFHLDFWRLDPREEPERHARHFALGFNAYCNQLALGLDFVDRTLNRPLFEKLLDEGAPELGIPPRAYARLKYNVVHVEHLARVLAVG